VVSFLLAFPPISYNKINEYSFLCILKFTKNITTDTWKENRHNNWQNSLCEPQPSLKDFARFVDHSVFTSLDFTTIYFFFTGKGHQPCVQAKENISKFFNATTKPINYLLHVSI
jgi:hypothetical protein